MRAIKKYGFICKLLHAAREMYIFLSLIPNRDEKKENRAIDRKYAKIDQ
jgi:hypothetical protein